MRSIISLIGILLMLMSITVAVATYNASTTTGLTATDQRSRIARGIEHIEHDLPDSSQLTEWLQARLRDLANAISVTIANAAEASGDYTTYLQQPSTRDDVRGLAAMLRPDPEPLSPIYMMISNQLLTIMGDYTHRLDLLPTLPIERRRVSGIVLSDRRQIAVLSAAIKLSNPPDRFMKLAVTADSLLRAS